MRFLQSAALIAVIAGIALFSYARLSAIDGMAMASLKIVDRNGVLLKEIHASQSGTAYPISLSTVPRHFIDTLLITEDKRFYSHHGIDPVAVGRSLALNAGRWKIVAGGSTLTQQLARNIDNNPRTMLNKCREAAQAVCFELRYPKERILEEYLNRAPFGNGAYGVEAASRLYFDKPIKDVTLAESAFLCAIPASNKLYNPYKRFTSVLKRQKRILSRLYADGAIHKDQYLTALFEQIALYPRRSSFLAPHFCDIAAAARKDVREGTLKTTLDSSIQRRVEYIVANHVSKLSAANVNNAAVIVVDNKTHGIRALVGSADFFDEAHNGQVNGALALRQPGSSIKPFVYGLAFENGILPSTALPDIKSSFEIPEGGVFMPKNYDKQYHGMVRARAALACSYNVATVNLSEQCGTDMLLAKLREAGFNSLARDAAFYGPGLSLGCGEVTLFELARAYCGIANGGVLNELKTSDGEPDLTGKRFFSPQVAYLLTDILSDNAARTPAFGSFSPINLPFKCAVKTGTSKNFRDNWTVGYTPRYTVAVWAGNFDGKPMYSVSGVSGAGPIFRDIMLTLEIRNPDRDFLKPAGMARRKVCAVSGAVPTTRCKETIEELFIIPCIPKKACTIHRLVKIDSRNKLLAASDCPREYVEEKIFEIYPSEYYEWAASANVEMPPCAISSLPGSGQAAQGADVCSVALPGNGDIYKIDPILRREYQTIPLKPRIGENIKQVKWRVDGKEIVADTYPFIVNWKLQQGKHVIDFVADSQGAISHSNQIEIMVLP